MPRMPQKKWQGRFSGVGRDLAGEKESPKTLKHFVTSKKTAKWQNGKTRVESWKETNIHKYNI